MNWDFLVEVISMDGETPYFATGYAIGPHRIITTGHLRPQSKLTVGDSVTVLLPATEQGGSRTKLQAQVAWVGEDPMDVAILACEPLSTSAPTCKLDGASPKSESRWTTQAWVFVGREPESNEVPRRALEFSGQVSGMNSTQEWFELRCAPELLSRDDWRGASGAPVFIDGMLSGIIRQCPDAKVMNRLLAVPICRLVEDEGFRQAIGLPSDHIDRREAWLTEMEVQFCDTLTQVKSEEVRNKAAGILGIEYSSNPKKLNPQVGIALRKVQGWRALDSWLAQFHELYLTTSNGSESEDAIRVADLIDILLPLLISEETVRLVNKKLLTASEGVIESTVAHYAGVELVMAQFDTRRPSFVAVYNGSTCEFVGEGLLRIGEEIPGDAKPEEVVRKILEDLARQVYVKLDPDPDDGSAESSIEEAACNIERPLEFLGLLKKMTQYCVIRVAKNGPQRDRILDLLTKVREKAPNIIFFELCDKSATRGSEEVALQLLVRRESARLSREVE